MALGSTVEHFEYSAGETVYVARLTDLPQPLLRKPTPTKEDPGTFTDTPLPPKKKYQPLKIIVSEQLTEACWRRFKECWTHCEVLNRALR